MATQQTARFVYPEDALPNDTKSVLSEEQVKQWRTNGYALINKVFPAELLQRVIAESADMLQSFEQPQDFGTGSEGEFPTLSEAVNEMSLHPRLLTAVQQLLGTADIRLIQADLWKKCGVEPMENYAPYSNVDQRMHMDFPNHTLVHPPLWSQPQAVEIIIYLSDSSQCAGCTALVPRSGDKDPAYVWPYVHMPGVGKLEWFNNAAFVEQYVKENDAEMYKFRQTLYEREKYARFEAGTVLFYRYDLWHRGTPLKCGETRFAQNMAFAAKDAYWVGQWNRACSYDMYRCKNRVPQFTEKLIVKLDAFQRSVIGFPKPGDAYWNEYTLQAVRQRYEPLGMDLTPYALAMKSQKDDVNKEKAVILSKL